MFQLQDHVQKWSRLGFIVFLFVFVVTERKRDNKHRSTLILRDLFKEVSGKVVFVFPMLMIYDELAFDFLKIYRDLGIS